MYDLATWEPSGVLSGHSWEGGKLILDCDALIISTHIYLVWQLALFDGLLLSGSFDHSVRVWDTTTKETVKVLEGHKGYIHALRAYPSEKLIITAGGDKLIKIWRT
jgi:WD40 repeat protein